MNSKIGVLFVLWIGVVLCTGCQETTFRAPTQTNSLRKIEADSTIDSVGLLSQHINEFTRQQLQNGRNQVIPFGEFTYGLVQVNASSGETYKAVTENLAIGIPDYSPLNLGANEFLNSQLNQQIYSQRQCLFMIWPIKLEQSFQLRMAETLSFDILKLGAASLASQRALDQWWMNGRETGSAPNRKLDRTKDQMLFLSQYNINMDWPGSQNENSLYFNGSAKKSTIDSYEFTMIPCGDLEMVLIKRTPEISTTDISPSAELFTNLMKDSPLTSAEVTLKVQKPKDANIEFSNTLPASVVTGPIDFRYMALELSGNFGIQQNWQYLKLNINAKKDFDSKLESKSSSAAWIIVRDTKSKIALYAWKSQ